jgi:hypothetical protein
VKNHCQLARLASLIVLSLLVVVAMTTPSSATGNIVKADLSGAWQMTIVGQTGCGFGTTLYTFTSTPAAHRRTSPGPITRLDVATVPAAATCSRFGR